MRDRQWQNPCRERLSRIPPFAAVSGGVSRQSALGLCSAHDNQWPQGLEIVGARGRNRVESGIRVRGSGFRVKVIDYQHASALCRLHTKS
jgi:hypothetical protein